MKKIGSIFMVSVLALAGVGISFAGFTDAVSVYGTVDTAYLNIDIEGYSCTYVWKIYDFEPNWDPQDDMYMDFDLAGEIAVYHGPCAIPGDLEDQYFYINEEQQCTYEYLTWATAEAGTGDFDIEVNFHNLFPCIWFKADFLLHYTGSIPGRVVGPITIDTINPVSPNFVDPTGMGLNWMEYLWSIGEIKLEAWRAYDDGYGNYIPDLSEPVLPGYQLHDCNYVYVLISWHIPQDDMYQGCTGEFSTEFKVIQWYDCD